MKKISSFYQFILEILQILESQGHAHFWHNVKIIKVTFKCPEFFPTHAYSFIPWDKDNFSVFGPEWPHPILTRSTSIFFNWLLISMNLHQRATNQTFSSFCSRNLVNLKILQCDWLRGFWPISLGPDFFEVWDLCKNTADVVNYLYRPNLENIND